MVENSLLYTELVQRARAATERRDWPEALELWNALRAQNPGGWLAYFHATNALRHMGRLDEAETLSAAAVRQFPDQPSIAIGHARVAADRGDWPEALRRWEAVWQRFPDRPEAHARVAEALRQLGRADEAEAVLADAVVRFPGHPSIAIAHARAAATRCDWPEALRRWEAVRARFADRPEGYAGAADALRELDRADEAEAVLSEAIVRFADYPSIAIAHARVAVRLRDWPEALRRWEHVRTRFPERPEGHTGAAAVRRTLQRLEEARKRKELVEQARATTARRDWPDALRQWDAFRQCYPDDPLGYLHVGRALRETDHLDEADALLRAAAARFPDHRRIAVEHARTATARRDWPAALTRWEAMRTRFPDHVAGYIGVARTMRVLGRLDDAMAIVAAGVAVLEAANERGAEEKTVVRAAAELTRLRNDILSRKDFSAKNAKGALERYKHLAKPSEHAVDLVRQVLQRNSAPVICEVGVGAGATSQELCRLLAGRGTIYFFDYQDIVDELARTLHEIGFANFQCFGCGQKTYESYNWPLAKLLLRMRAEDRDGIFDFAYLDGAHAFHHDAPAALILKDLLKPDGIILLDDYDWSFATSPTLNPTVNPEITRHYSQEQLVTPHVKLVCDLFFDADPTFQKLDIGGGRREHRRAYRKLGQSI